MKKFIVITFLVSFFQSSMQGHNLELMLQVVNSNGTPISLDVKLYTPDNLITPFRSAWSTDITL